MADTLKAKVKDRVLNKVKPPDMGRESSYWHDNFNTKLDSTQEMHFQSWLKENSEAHGRDLSKDLQDYDVRGFWKGHTGAKKKGEHGPDTFKKPNHPTFSDESIYHGTKSPVGGKFEGGRWIDMGQPVNARSAGMGPHDNTTRTEPARKNWVFHPSDTMMKTTHKEKDMKKYFDKYEHDVHLVLPFKSKR